LERGSSWLKAAHANSDVGAGNLIDELGRNARPESVFWESADCRRWIYFVPSAEIAFSGLLSALFCSIIKTESECVKFYLSHTSKYRQ
jgi:hypothetical protein